MTREQKRIKKRFYLSWYFNIYYDTIEQPPLENMKENSYANTSTQTCQYLVTYVTTSHHERDKTSSRSCRGKNVSFHDFSHPHPFALIFRPLGPA